MLNDALQKLEATARSPKRAMEAYRQAGRPVAGCIPEYTPEVMVHAAGFIPFGLWGGETTIMLADSYIPTFACSLVRSCAEYGLNGTYRGLSFIIAPILCDALKGCVQTFRVAVKDPPVLPFSLPQNRTLPSAAAFTAQEYRALGEKIQKLTGAGITEQAMRRSIRIYNEHSRAMRDFDRAAAEHTDVIGARARQAVFKSAWFMEKEEHTGLVRQITRELEERPACRKNPARVVLTGVSAGSAALMELLEEEGFDVVGDHVYQDSWTYLHPIREDLEDPVMALAEHWIQVGGSCVAHERRRSRSAAVLKLAKEREAGAVVLCLMKFCDPEEYEAPLMLAELKKSCPTLTLDIDQNSDNLEQLRTKIQTFRDVLDS